MYQIRLARREDMPDPARPSGTINVIKEEILSPAYRKMAFGRVEIRGTRYAFIEASCLRMERDANLVDELSAATKAEMRRYRGRELPQAFTLSVSMAPDEHIVTTS
jgi:hypothetical protein